MKVNNNSLFLLEELVKKNFSSKYKDSVIGIFWSVLKPLMIMALFTIIFSTIFSRNIDNYPVYFLSGKCIYDFFVGGIGVSLNSIKSNKGILQRTAAPKHIFILASVISEFFNFIISLILLVGVMIVTNAQFFWTIPYSILPVIPLSIMVTGFAFALSILSVYYSDIQHFWSVVSMMLMYASGVFFPMSIIPEPYHQYMILNPVFWLIDQFRCYIYRGVFPDTMNMINLFLLSIIIFLIGFIIYKKLEKEVTMKF